METTLDATLYKRGRVATVLADGFGAYTRNDAALEVIDGVVHVSKFGVYTTGPFRKSKIEDDIERYGEDIFDEITECQLKVFGNINNDVICIPTTLDERVLPSSAWLLVDTEEDNRVYEVRSNEADSNEVILSQGPANIQLFDSEALKEQIGGRYRPAVRVWRDPQE